MCNSGRAWSWSVEDPGRGAAAAALQADGVCAVKHRSPVNDCGRLCD